MMSAIEWIRRNPWIWLVLLIVLMLFLGMALVVISILNAPEIVT
jgi:hypothetical protein